MSDTTAKSILLDSRVGWRAATTALSPDPNGALRIDALPGRAQRPTPAPAVVPPGKVLPMLTSGEGSAPQFFPSVATADGPAFVGDPTVAQARDLEVWRFMRGRAAAQ